MQVYLYRYCTILFFPQSWIRRHGITITLMPDTCLHCIPWFRTPNQRLRPIRWECVKCRWDRCDPCARNAKWWAWTWWWTITGARWGTTTTCAAIIISCSANLTDRWTCADSFDHRIRRCGWITIIWITFFIVFYLTYGWVLYATAHGDCFSFFLLFCPTPNFILQAPRTLPQQSRSPNDTVSQRGSKYLENIEAYTVYVSIKFLLRNLLQTEIDGNKK